MITLNGRVALEPFPDMSVKTSMQGEGVTKVARIENKSELVKLVVRSNTDDGKFLEGDVALVRGSHYVQFWAKEVFPSWGGDSKPYILVPYVNIEAIIRV